MPTCKICREDFESLPELVRHVDDDEFHSNATYDGMTIREFCDIFAKGGAREVL